MEQQDAVSLIHGAFDSVHTPQKWLDLGCGSGTFTRALHTVLPIGSEIMAVDIQPQHFEAPISFLRADFTQPIDLPHQYWDGILLANSIHFVENKLDILQMLSKFLTSNGKWLFVEYEMSKSNQWVPFPIGFEKLQKLMSELNYNQVQKIGEMSSAYQKGKIYAAQAF